MSSVQKAHLALFIVALIYGANYSIAKLILDPQHIMPLNLVLIRVGAGASLFAIFHQLFIREKIKRADFGRFLLCAVTGVVINQSFFIAGLKFTTPINASLIMTTTPILVLVTAAIIIKERITNRKILGIALGLTGAVALILLKNGNINWELDNLKGDLMILINAISYGTYLVFVKTLMKKYHPITIVKWIFLIGFVIMLPIGGPGFSEIDWQSFPTAVWWALFYVLIATTFLAYLLNVTALKVVNPSVVSIYIYLQPLIATVIALMIGKDVLTFWKVAAGVLIFVGVYLVSWTRSPSD